ncbi:MAG TPA: DUF305 domain-containing protein [Bacteroidia bacterium]|nr:DUF305 domain-containing protein [Bacteroidia bacterium]
MEMENQKLMHGAKQHSKHYKKLLIMAVLSFISMYLLMYAMVNSFSNVFVNVNQFYMAGLMSASMIIIEVALMSTMYMNKKLNALIIAISSVALIAFFAFIRQQSGVSDKQFLKSMIPHHGAAILMCKKASIQDPEIEELCRNVIKNQQAEIVQMKAKLKELEK